MPKLVLSFLFCFAVLSASSQRILWEGKVVDSLSGKGLGAATVSLVRAGDSALVTFSIADSAGNFRLEASAGVSYLLSVSYTGYSPVWERLQEVKAAASGKAGGIRAIGKVEMVPAGRLQAAEVEGRRPPVVINNDTIEFNAENFRTQPNAVVEDMLRKIPGVTVGSDGTVKVNGQTVKRILVNGKEFFTGDIKMATKNLNADAVDKLQVYDRKSDQASFTGVDDGNSEKTINIQLKKDKNYATFGKVAAGFGSDLAETGNNGRFDAQANINRFRGDEQLSFLGMGNNTDRQGFSLMDVLNFTGELAKGMRNGGGGISIQTGNAGNNNGLPVTGLGQNQQGIATTFAGGVNYNNSWDKEKSSLNANYMASNIRLLTDRESLVQNLAPGDNYNTMDSTRTVNTITQQRLGVVLDQQIDPSFSFRLTPVLTLQRSAKTQSEDYTSISPADMLLNDGFSNTGGSPGAVNLATDALLRKRLAKKGRTLSADINITYNHSFQGGSQLSDNSFYESGASPVDSNINQLYHRDAVTRSIGGNLTYTEPVGSRSLMAVSGFYNVNTGNTDKTTNDYNAVSGKWDLPDSLLSNRFGSDYRYGGGGLSFRSNPGKWHLTAGANVQAATLKALNLSGGSTIRQSFTDVLPNAILQYAISTTSNLQLNYTTYTTQPSVVQLQPVPDLSDPLNISTGNPALKRTYTQNLTGSYIHADPAARTHLLMMLGLTYAANAIVQSDSVSAYGTRVIMPVNANGVGNVLNDIAYGFPVRSWHGRIEIGETFTYSKNVDLINGAKDNVQTTTFRPGLSYTYNENDQLDIGLTAAVSLNTGRYSLQPHLNTNYVRQNYGVNMTNYLPMGLSLHNEFNYIFNTGRTQGYNTSTPLWNLSVAKTLLRHDRGELKLSVMDVLDRNIGITRSVGQGSVQDVRYNVLRRYFLLTWTYSLNKSGLKARGGPMINIRKIGD